MNIRIDVRERTICLGDYVVRRTDLQDRQLLSVDVGMKKDLRTNQMILGLGQCQCIIKLRKADLVNGRFNLGGS